MRNRRINKVKTPAIIVSSTNNIKALSSSTIITSDMSEYINIQNLSVRKPKRKTK